jgi:small subunit ribosomal protein S20
MANLKSAKKRAIQNKKRQACNQARRSEFKTLTKKFFEALEDKDMATARELMLLAESQLARAKSKRVVKANTASRKISRMARKLSTIEKK